MRKGMWFGVGAYVMWGLLPLFWRALHGVPALEILAHRMVWSLLVVLALGAAQGRWRWLGAALRNPRLLLTVGAAATLLSLNWFVYIWAVNAGHIVESSLGYFLNPLVNVGLGVVLLHERLRRGQAVAIAVAVGGVLYLTVQLGAAPWIALTLAGSFGVYGFLRKTSSLNALEGLTLETLLLFVPALSVVLYQAFTGAGAFGAAGATTSALLVLAGVVTAAPLLLFAAAARRITLTSLGILQYIAPTLQFLIGVAIFHEPLQPARLVGFALIWLALAIYAAEGVVQSRASRAAAPGA